MTTLYVVRPDQRGISVYESWGIEHSWVTPPRLNVFSAEEPFLPPVVQRCSVRRNSVCEHGWFCTDERGVAEMVDELRAELERVRAERDAACVDLVRERGDAVAWMRRGMDCWQYAVAFAVDHIERGEHRREEEK